MLLLERGPTTPPVFVKLRGELTEEGGGECAPLGKTHLGVVWVLERYQFCISFESSKSLFEDIRLRGNA